MSSYTAFKNSLASKRTLSEKFKFTYVVKPNLLFELNIEGRHLGITPKELPEK